MASSAKSGRDFIYFVPLPSVSRDIAIAFSTVFILMFSYLPFRLGFGRTCSSIKEDPSLWLILLLIFGSGAGWMIRLAFPSRRSRARLEFGPETVRYIPGRILRWLRHPSFEALLTPQAVEIILCRGSQDFRSDARGNRVDFPYGFRVIVRSTGAHDREVKVATGDRLSAHQARVLINGITAATTLPVRFVQRERAPDGAIREVPWVPTARKRDWTLIAGLAFAATPYVSGTIAGFLGLNPVIAACAGMALWLAMTFAIVAIARRFPDQKKFPTLYWLTTLVTFAAVYTVAFAFTNYLTHGH